MATTNGSSEASTSAAPTFPQLLKKLVVSPATLSSADITSLFLSLASESTTPPQIAAFLTAFRLHGLDAKPEVIAAAAAAMRELSVKVKGGEGASDIVGTGGDGFNTFNVSTTAGIVAAGAGAKVFKHGSKASTSASGSADILLSLGCPISTLPPSSIPSVAANSPFLFLFAATYHPAIARIAPVRRELPFPTIFNVLGPLLNPARPEYMVVGVYSEKLGTVFAEALRLLGVKRAWVVCGQEGLDEISPAGETSVWEVQNNAVKTFTLSPASFGLPSNSLASVEGGSPAENASTLIALLSNELGTANPIENFVVMNAAALLVVSGVAEDLKDGVKRARDSIESGKAKGALEAFRRAATDEVALQAAKMEQ